MISIELSCPEADCKAVFNSRNELKAHIRLHENSLRKYKCTTCGQGFAQRSSLNKHKRTHDGLRPYVCSHPGCQASFTQKCNLNRHMLLHSGEKHFTCEICDKAFRTKSNLTQHLNGKHALTEPHKCEHCGKQFQYEQTYKKHILLRHTAGESTHLPESQDNSLEIVLDNYFAQPQEIVLDITA